MCAPSNASGKLKANRRNCSAVTTISRCEPNDSTSSWWKPLTSVRGAVPSGAAERKVRWKWALARASPHSVVEHATQLCALQQGIQGLRGKPTSLRLSTDFVENSNRHLLHRLVPRPFYGKKLYSAEF